MNIEPGCNKISEKEVSQLLQLSRRGKKRGPKNQIVHELGLPIPNDPHAVSVCMPMWQDNINYEEGVQEVHEALQSGYPRFALHPKVKRLMDVCTSIFCIDDERCLAFPTVDIGVECREFILKQLGSVHSSSSSLSSCVRIHKLIVEKLPPHHDHHHHHTNCVRPECVAPVLDHLEEHDTNVLISVVVVGAPPSESSLSCGEVFGHLKSFWQHTGQIISSRLASSILMKIQHSVEGYRQEKENKFTILYDNEVYNTRRLKQRSSNNTSSENDDYDYDEDHQSDKLGHVLTLEDQPDECQEYIEEHYGRKMSVSQQALAKDLIKERVANFLGETDSRNCYLYPTGMSAIYNTYKLLSSEKPKLKPVMFGFPYLDTLKILQKFGCGCHFFGYGDESDLNKLEVLLKEEEILAIFCEFPNNPLLKSVDIERLSQLASDYGFPLVIDDTVSAPFVANILPMADVVCTSLTKMFSGDGNVMGGSLVLNSQSSKFERLKKLLDDRFVDNYFGEDAIVMERNCRDVEKRCLMASTNAERICDYLVKRDEVELLHFPKYSSQENFLKFQRTGQKFGFLFSMVLKNHEKTSQFFDALQVCKGPSLGTNFTLCCPYTLLAHYGELELAEQYGISRNLIRVSIGIENGEHLIELFDQAFDVINKS